MPEAMTQPVEKAATCERSELEEGEALDLSVIVVSYNAKATIQRCLSSLTGQTGGQKYEIIVVDSSDDDTADVVAAHYPNVRLFTFSQRKYPGDARNFAIEKARGQIIGFVDSDCVAAANWVTAVTAAHQQEDPVLGGAVAHGSPESYVGWGYYFSEFFHWIPGTAAGPMDDIPTCTLSMKRWAFDAWGPYLEGTYCSDSAFNWKMSQDGSKPMFTPAIEVAHLYEKSLWQFIKHEVQHGRFFAKVRVSEECLSLRDRLYNAACAPVRPFIWPIRIGRIVLKHRGYRKAFLSAVPVVFVGRAAWAWGELLGYLTPTGSRKG